MFFLGAMEAGSGKRLRKNEELRPPEEEDNLKFESAWDHVTGDDLYPKAV